MLLAHVLLLASYSNPLGDVLTLLGMLQVSGLFSTFCLQLSWRSVLTYEKLFENWIG